MSFDDYELLDEIAHGGMGVVYRARQISLDRTVAVKMVLFGQFAGQAAFERFRREAETIAHLQHPNIVAIHEIGETDGQPYFSMDYVAGRNLAELVRDRPLPMRQAATYVGKIARAVQYAHELGVLHRDLKPSNVLIDQNGEPRITDFGLAKRMVSDSEAPSPNLQTPTSNSQPSTLNPQLTLSGQVLGSPNFMPPEQGGGRHAKIGPASDVYGLGALLYYLLTARPPFVADTFEATLAQVLYNEPVTPRQLNPGIPRDLETLCLKCLEKDPSRRYATAGVVADDLDRFLRGEPIVARPVGLMGRVWRWSRRKPVLAALTGAVALLLLAVTAVSLVAAWRIATARKAEQRESYYSSIALAKQYIEQGSIDRALEVLWKCPERYRHWEWGHLLYLCHQDMVSLNAHQTNVVALEFSANNRWLVSLDAAGLAKVWDWQAKTQVFALGDVSNPVSGVVFSPNGEQLAAAVGTNGVQVWAVGTWHEVHRLVGHGGGVSALAYSPDSRLLAAAGTGGKEGTVKVWDAASGRELRSLKGPVGTVRRVAISPEGRRLVAVGERSVRVWDLETGTLLRTLPENVGGESRSDSAGAPVSRGAVGMVLTRDIYGLFADDRGEHFATIDTRGRFSLWHEGVASRPLITIKSVHPVHVQRAFFSPDGRWVVNGGEDNTARLWEVATETEQVAINEKVSRVRFSADASKMVTVGMENWATVWDLPQHRKVKVLYGHNRIVVSAALSRDGRLVATGDERGTIKVWSASRGREFLEEETWHWSGAYSPDGRWIVSSPVMKGWVLRSCQSGRVRLRVQPAHEGSLVVLSPDGRRLATAGLQKTAKVWEVESGRLLLTLRGHRRQVFALAYSRDGRLIATGSMDGTARVWDAQTGAELRTLFVDVPLRRAELRKAPSENLDRLQSGPRGARPSEARAMLTSTNPPRPYEGPGYSHGVMAVEFNADGSRLFTGGCDGKARLWDLQTGELVAQFEATKIATRVDLKLHPDGKHLVTHSQDGWLRLWEIASGRLIKEAKTRGFHSGFGLAVTADGRRLIAETSLGLAAGADTGTIEVWDFEGVPREILTLSGPVVFDSPTIGPGPMGRRIMAGGGDCALHQWEAFPWETEEYSGDRWRGSGFRVQGLGLSNQWSVISDQSEVFGGRHGGMELPEDVRRYADTYWRERFAAECEAEVSIAPPKVITLPVDRALFPKRDSNATPKQIDLTAYYTGELTEPFYFNGDSFRQDNDLSGLPAGLVTLGGVAFDVRGVIQLRFTHPLGGGWAAIWRDSPERIEGIPVEQTSRRLHLLLGATGEHDSLSGQGLLPETEGTTIGTVVLHYADGETSRLDLVLGRDVRDWWYDPSKTTPETTDRGKVVWTGTNPVVEEVGFGLRLYLTSRENPHPDVKIATIDLVSAMSRAAPFIIAVTIE